MKKNATRGGILLAVILIVYNVIVFTLPFVKGPVFFLSWIFTLIAIGAQGYVMRVAFSRDEGAKSKFYGWPIARIGAIYLIAQLVLGLVFMAMGAFIPLWVPFLLYVVLTGAAAAGLVAADTVRDEVRQQDIKLKKNVACMRALQSKAATMAQLAQDAQVRKALEQFSEDLRFSDPVSDEALADIEADLTACVDELYQAVVEGDGANTLDLVQKAGTILMERNRQCKLGKSAAH